MIYAQTLNYLYQQLPMFHRVGAAAYKNDLSNTLALSRILGQPEKKYPSVHIAGTNGKGSSSHFLASILQDAGYKTGLFTSPHLKDFRERIKINGRMIPKHKVTVFVETYKNDFAVVEPSFFEWTFALASWYFAQEKIDIAVMETGMGGRLDSTNIVNPVVTIITNIGLDHTQFLGATLSQIAREKAGIIKRNVPVIIGETHAETENVFKWMAAENNSEIYFADQTITLNATSYTKHRPALLKVGFCSAFTDKKYNLLSPLSGQYQNKNLKTVILAAEVLKGIGYRIDNKNIIDGVRRVMIHTKLLGRWQTLKQTPLTIADIGHNADGIREVLGQIALTPHKQLHFVLGIVNDKDVTAMLRQLPKDAVYYFCKADIPRGLDANILAEQAENEGLSGNVYAGVRDALVAAQAHAKKDDLVFVGGSAFVVAEVL